MGRKETIQYFCDIEGCGKEMFGAEAVKHEVIFTTEQTEGRGVKPYFSNNELFVCSDCAEHMLRGNYIFASGAMGHNRYYFKKEKADHGKTKD